jgi:hypothetical protein
MRAKSRRRQSKDKEHAVAEQPEQLDKTLTQLIQEEMVEPGNVEIESDGDWMNRE